MPKVWRRRCSGGSLTSTIPARSDADILDEVIGLHHTKTPTIIDTTAGGLRMWRGCRA